MPIRITEKGHGRKFTHSQLLTMALEDHILFCSMVGTLLEELINHCSDIGVEFPEDSSYTQKFNTVMASIETISKAAKYVISESPEHS